MIKNETIYFKISGECLENIYSIKDYYSNKKICSLKWINTRNVFSLHILKSLLDYQSEYWFSGKSTDLKPLPLNRFLCLYPLQYLDQSRLSRLLSNLSVVNSQNHAINLRELFISKKKHNSYLIKEIINNREKGLKDKDIQYLLAQKGVHLSLRTICNCRKLINIPNWKEISGYYEKGINFSNYLLLSKKCLNKIPNEAGVYEASISLKVDYKNHRSNVIYIGSSKNLRKRIGNYTGGKLKNTTLNRFINKGDVFLCFCLTEDYFAVENRLLKSFEKIFGELPRANSLGG